MPANLNVVVLKPADTDNPTDRTVRQLQFSREFTIRKDIVLKQLYFLKSNYPRYRDVQINNYIDLLYNGNVIDQVTTARYKDTGPSRDTASNQRPRTQLEANPTNSAEADATAIPAYNDNNDNRFDSSTVLALDIDRNIDDLRRQVGARKRPLSSRQPEQRLVLTQLDVEERLLSEQVEL